MLESDEFIATHRTNPTDFTRRRTLTLSMLVTCLAQGFIEGLRHQRHFCMRVDAMAFKDVDAFLYQSTEVEKIVTITMPAPAVRKAAKSGYALEQTTFSVRLIRVPLPGGKREMLVTSLLDSATYPASEFGALYHQRWRIEECFKLLKCRLAVEHFSGELPDSVRQDFLAKVWLGNLTATFAYLARVSLPDEKRAHFLPNLTYAVTALRASLPRLMTKARNRARMVKDLLKLVADTLEWLRPDRHFPRHRQAVKPIRYRAYKAIR